MNRERIRERRRRNKIERQRERREGERATNKMYQFTQQNNIVEREKQEIKTRKTNKNIENFLPPYPFLSLPPPDPTTENSAPS